MSAFEPDQGDGTAPPEENFWDDRTTPHYSSAHSNPEPGWGAQVRVLVLNAPNAVVSVYDQEGNFIPASVVIRSSDNADQPTIVAPDSEQVRVAGRDGNIDGLQVHKGDRVILRETTPVTAIDELRQALAEWDRLTKAATPGPWGATNRFFKHDHRVEMFLNGEPYSTVASPSTKGNADLIVAAVGLADTVRAILAEAIDWLMEAPTDDDAFANGQVEIALRLARKINENATA